MPEEPIVEVPDRAGSDDDAWEGGSNLESAPMIEKLGGSQTRKRHGNTTILFYLIGILLLASLTGNAVLLTALPQGNHDLDDVCSKYTSQYC
jgi:hypothetical protein